MKQIKTENPRAKVTGEVHKILKDISKDPLLFLALLSQAGLMMATSKEEKGAFYYLQNLAFREDLLMKQEMLQNKNTKSSKKPSKKTTKVKK